MVSISLKNVGKKFTGQPLFSGLNNTFEAKQKYALTGSNGSGKSTLLQIIAGTEPPTSGDVVWNKNGKLLPAAHWFRELSIAAPYLELIEELTLTELLQFHFRFKHIMQGYNAKDLPNLLQLPAQKQIQFFSSGMKQKLRLALALWSNTSVLLLDEPTSNLDDKNKQWYQEHVQKMSEHRLLIIASNEPEEYSFCKHVLKVNGR